MRAKNRVIVITGASSGIARATALRFAKKGALLVLASRRKGALDELAAECEGLGGQAIVVPTDTTKEEEVFRLARAALDRFGRIDVWINAAAASVFSSFATMPLDEFRRVMDLNIMGYVYGTRAALDAMLRRRRGLIINVASVIAEVPQPYTAPYSMSKAAVRALGGSIRSELRLQKERHIHVATVLPPTVDTPFYRHAGNFSGRRVQAMPPVYSAKKIAKAIVNLAGSPRDEVVVSRAGKFLVRQHRVMPRMAEREMARLTAATQLSPWKGAPHTSGNLFDPAPDADAEVSGGWKGRARSRLRRRILLVVLAIASTVVVRRLLAARR